jgi:hypothetical protein
MKHDVSEAGSPSVFRQGNHQIRWTPHKEIFSVTRHNISVNLLRYAPESRCSAKVDLFSGTKAGF